MTDKIANLALAAGLATALATTLAAPAAASTVVLDVDGPLGGLALLGPVTGYDTVATTFTVNATIANAALGLTIACYDACAGRVYLFSSAPTPDAVPRDLQAISGFAGPQGNTSALALADIVTTGRAAGPLTLEAGLTYSLVLQVEAGGVAWYASGAAMFDATYITPGPGYISLPSNKSNVIEYPYVLLADLGHNPLLYIITGDPLVSAVPLPAALPMLLAGLVWLGLLGRRRHRPQIL